MRDIYNLDGHRVSKIIYGTIIILVVILAMEDHPPSPLGTVVTILFSGLGVALAELYSDFIGTKIDKRSSLTWEDRKRITQNVSAVMIGALLPLPLIVLAWLGVFSLEFAIFLDKWLLVMVLLFYGFVAAKLSGYSNVWSLASAFGVSAVGLFVVMLKSAFGH